MTASLTLFAWTPNRPPHRGLARPREFCGWCACPAIHFCAEFTHPWAILSSPPEMLASRLFPGGSADAVPYRHAGAMRVERGGVAPITVETGDVVVFARGIQHVLASKAGLAPVPI